MIRCQELIDKLVADLHFHHYLFVDVGDNIFTKENEFLNNVDNFLKSIGLDKEISAHTDFYHGGNVVTQRAIEHIYRYIDDVFIDYFFRTHRFRPILIPKGFCNQQITPKGIIEPANDVEIILNLNNIYDRCTFVRMIYSLFGQKESKLYELFPNNHFINGFSLNDIQSCLILENEYPYGEELFLYIENKYKYSKFDPTQRANEIIAFNHFCTENSYNFKHEGFTQLWLKKYCNKIWDYKRIKDSKIFGEYCIEDILMLYVLLIDRFVLSEEKITAFLSPHIDVNREDSILSEFKNFENRHTDAKDIEPFIKSKDLYLRFASRTKSCAFKFTQQDELFESIQLFNQNPIRSLVYCNPIALPYLYNTLNLY